MTSPTGYDLRIGDLSLMDNQDNVFRLAALGADASLGNPVPVSEVITSLLRDGDLTTTTRFGNRTASFLVEITAPDAGGLASGEAALMAELDQVNTLTWQVPYGADTLFDVIRSWPEFMMDDLVEVRQIKRTYRVTFECAPFGRSEGLVTVAWTGPGTEISTTSTTGYTVVGGGAIAVSGGHIQKTTTASNLTLSRSVAMDEYLWIKTEGEVPVSARHITSVTVNGTAIPDAQIRQEAGSSKHFYTIPTGAWQGTTATVQFTITPWAAGSNRAILEEFWTVSYPNQFTAGSNTSPKGIGVISTIGSARAPCTISFTAPAGGAFVYTAPDPNVLLREQGAAENVFAYFTVASADGDEYGVGPVLMWFPQGTHAAQIGFTDARPAELYPDGLWPTATPTALAQWINPADTRAAVSFFNTTGVKTLVSPSPSLPTGYDTAAMVHEVHAVYPGRMGFAVLDQNNDPIAATLTYYPHWWTHAGQ
ncbi:hypothetical protein [Jatrophihabitans sp.]|uniref:hypothetical protein n=1 Tax=Jatrophihabitans sp. TaxID=1932789 RepID=UPI0030C78298|nr:hypothetical protein [Jatrophihabitans sp.]